MNADDKQFWLSKHEARPNPAWAGLAHPAGDAAGRLAQSPKPGLFAAAPGGAAPAANQTLSQFSRACLLLLLLLLLRSPRPALRAQHASCCNAEGSPHPAPPQPSLGVRSEQI
jgi:hypothetical protein